MKISKLEVLIATLTVVIGTSTFVVTKVLAEQSGGTPDSGTASILKETYDNLVSLNHGTEEGSNGTMWNRIISSANWVPNTGITSDQVLKDVQYYEDSRTVKSGTYDAPNYQAMSLQQMDYRAVYAEDSWSTWNKTNAVIEVWKDNRTGLYWSPRQGAENSVTNDFSLSCQYFSSTPRGSYSGGDATCGNAINTCANLSLDANGDGTPETDWYLPTQVELMQAYINGMFQRTNQSWVTYSTFWSSTQNQSNTANAWYVSLFSGYTLNPTKVTSYSVRCVHRD